MHTVPIDLGRLLCAVILWEAGGRRGTKGQASLGIVQQGEVGSPSLVWLDFGCHRGAWDSEAWQGLLVAFALISVSP